MKFSFRALFLALALSIGFGAATQVRAYNDYLTEPQWMGVTGALATLLVVGVPVIAWYRKYCDKLLKRKTDLILKLAMDTSGNVNKPCEEKLKKNFKRWIFFPNPRISELVNKYYNKPSSAERLMSLKTISKKVLEA
jgi:hypothetical protein